MEFGLFIVNIEYDRLRKLAGEAEAAGYHLLVCPDHFVQEGAEGQYDPHCLSYDPIISTAAMAEGTRKVKLGHLVLCNLFRHPAVTARSLASLDHLSGGRMVAGLGTGWTEGEFRMTGIQFPDITTRLRMLDEALTCLRLLWTQEQSTFSGEFYNLQDAILWPKPVQKPYPSIIVGGGGKGLLRIAARHADVVNVIIEVGSLGQITTRRIANLTDEAFGKKVTFVRQEAHKANRTQGELRVGSAVFNIALTDSEQATEATAETIGKQMGMSPKDVLRSPMMLIGTPAQCVNELRRRISTWGLSQITFSYSDDANMKRLAQEVLAKI